MYQIRNTAWKGGFLRYASVRFIYIFLGTTWCKESVWLTQIRHNLILIMIFQSFEGDFYETKGELKVKLNLLLIAQRRNFLLELILPLPTFSARGRHLVRFQISNSWLILSLQEHLIF